MKFIRAEKIDLKCVICDDNVIYGTNYKVSNYPIKKYVCYSCCANKDNVTSDLVVELSIYNRCKIISPDVFKRVHNSFLTGACRKNNNTHHKFNNVNDIDGCFISLGKNYSEFTSDGFYKVLSLIDCDYMEVIGFEKLDTPIVLECELFDEINKLMPEYDKLR